LEDIPEWPKNDPKMKVFCLFCFVYTYEIHQIGMLQIMFFVSLENSQQGGVHGLGVVVFALAMPKFLNIE
jgi:hypothetical protein